MRELDAAGDCGGRGRREAELGAVTGPLHIGACQQCGILVIELNGTIARAAVSWRKHHIDRAGFIFAVCGAGTAGAARPEGEVKIWVPLGEDLDGSGGVAVEGGSRGELKRGGERAAAADGRRGGRVAAGRRGDDLDGPRDGRGSVVVRVAVLRGLDGERAGSRNCDVGGAGDLDGIGGGP